MCRTYDTVDSTVVVIRYARNTDETLTKRKSLLKGGSFSLSTMNWISDMIQDVNRAFSVSAGSWSLIISYPWGWLVSFAVDPLCPTLPYKSFQGSRGKGSGIQDSGVQEHFFCVVSSSFGGFVACLANYDRFVPFRPIIIFNHKVISHLQRSGKLPYSQLSR